MELGIEPKGVDLVVEPTKSTREDIELVANAIAHFKATGQKLSLPRIESRPSRKGKIVKPKQRQAQKRTIASFQRVPKSVDKTN
jgi:hypothetical protein